MTLKRGLLRGGWLVVLEFNATLTATVISWQSVTHVSWLSHTSTNTNFFPKPLTTCTFLTCFSRGGSQKFERKFASTGSRTHNHQVISLTHLSLSHLGWARPFENIVETSIFSFPTMFSNRSKTNFNFSITFNLSSANAFNLDQSKVL